MEDEEGIARALELDAGDAVTHQVTSGPISPVSLSDLEFNSDQNMLSEEPLASGFGDLQAPSPPSPFDFSVSSSELDMIKNSMMEVREW